MTDDLQQQLETLSADDLELLELLLAEEGATIEAPGSSLTGEAAAYPLSFAQQRLWFINQMVPGTSLYNMPFAYHLTGPLNVPALRQSLREIVARHAVLRTTLITREGTPWQVVRDAPDFDVPLVDLQHLPPAERDEAALTLIKRDLKEPFDFERDLMLRAYLYRLDNATHLLGIVMHHVASDGWSISVFWRELKALYAAFSAGEPSPLPPLLMQYAEFSVRQRGWLQGDFLKRQLDYWRRRLDGLPELDLPTDHSRPAVFTYQGTVEQFEIPAALTAQMNACARQEGVTLYMLLLAALQALLFRYTGQEDFAIGSPIANRNHHETEELIGFFANTLVMRADLSGDPTFRELLRRVRAVALEAYDNQDLPFEGLVEELRPQRDLSRNPLFEVLLALQNTPTEAPGLAGLAIERVSTRTNDTSKFDLHLDLSFRPDRLAGRVQYRTALFEAATIRRLIDHYQTLLAAATADPERRISQLPLLTATEQRHVLTELSAAAAPAQPTPLVHQLFEAQTRRTPDAVALVDGERQLTYQQLNQRASRVARRLRALQIGPDTCVALYMSRTLETFVTTLGILKAGGAYLPLDPLHPPERLEAILQEAQPALLITPPGQSSPVRAAGIPALDISILEAQAAGLADDDPGFPVSGEHLAYTMYTSGSTGRPKGIAMPHRVLANLINWQQSHPVLGRPARTLQYSALTFDVSFQEIFSTWCSGGQLVLLAPETRLDPYALAEEIRRQGIERLYLPNIALQQIAPIVAKDIEGYTLQTIVTAGEQLLVSPDVRRIAAARADFTLHNHYGPTEAHVVSHFTLAGDPHEWPTLPPIGRPIPGARLYVLDSQGQLLPAGIPGELAIGGPVLARGYLHRPDLTAERFVADPFSGEPGATMYLTGDLARWLPSGDLEYLGRLDRQVKIRGFRIEPGEIEAALVRHATVREAVVITREDQPGDRRLVAYLVPDGDRPLAGPAELRAFLGQSLPDYMIPSAFVSLPHTPLTPHGKIDLAALPLPDAAARTNDATGYVAPRTPAEEGIADIWREVLRLEQVGVDDNFFDLGGHSLLATQVIARIEDRFGRRLPLSLLFTASTVAQLATHLERPAVVEESPILVPIHGEGNQRPFFCVHGFGGGVLGYADLARLMGSDRPFYGLQARGLNGNAPADTAIDVMAARYIDAMREAQPHGPYRIGGYCFGGVVAFEMARQLEASGEEVALVALIEGYAPMRYQHKRPFNSRQRWRTVWQNIPYWIHDYWELGLEGIRLRAKRKGRIWYKRLATRFRREALVDAQDLIADDLSVLPDYHRQLMEIHLSALRHYKPAPISSGVVLFAARGKTISAALFGSADPEHGWGELAHGGVAVDVVDGGHRNIHLQPHVASLAAALEERLKAAE